MQFRDLKRQYEHLKTQIDDGMAEVITSASFISGPQVRALEEQLAAYVGVKHCITCANGTDAISIALEAWGIGPGDAVFVPDFTFFSTGECPAAAGATTIFVDVRRDTYNMDPAALETAIEEVLAEGKVRPKVVIAVDLFGLPADYERICDVCKKYGLLLLEDGAQGFGGSITNHLGHERKACSFGDISTTSFFPAKPLGCYGDGGAIFTDNDEWATLCRSIAVHGKDMEHQDDPMAKYNNLRIGRNSRLDTLQAAVLLAKLRAFQDEELAAVNRVAEHYTELLDGSGLMLPEVAPGYYSSWAQYTVQLPDGVDRDAVQTQMKQAGIPTMVYYVKPMHLQGAFAGTRSAQAHCPVTEDLCGRVLCLPMHPYLTEEEVAEVVRVLKECMD